MQADWKSDEPMHLSYIFPSLFPTCLEGMPVHTVVHMHLIQQQLMYSRPLMPIIDGWDFVDDLSIDYIYYMYTNCLPG